jgi:CheY-like chemotaxis protein
MTVARIGSILIVEDDPDVRDAIAAFLRAEGFSIATAVDGSRALDMLARGPAPALILLDYMMPHMNAVEFCRERDRLGVAPGVPIVVLTAAASMLASILRDCGAVEALQKPFELDDLVRVAEKYAVKGPAPGAVP